jgi:hypothetical protein
VWGFLRNVFHYATLAWGVVAGIPGDVGRALDHIFRFAASVHTLVDHLVSSVLRAAHAAILNVFSASMGLFSDIINALYRIDPFIRHKYVIPLVAWVNARIWALRNWTAARLTALALYVVSLYRKSLAYTQHMVGVERKQRIADVRAARTYALRLVAAAHAAIELEAVHGYRDGNSQRLTAIQKLTDEIAQRNPLIRALVKDFVTLLIDALGAENPLERIALQFLLREVINKLGVDRVAGDLLGRIAGPLIADPRPKNLHDVVKDLAQRVSGMENQWSDFMTDGGPEVEQAGKQWKSYTSAITDASLLAFFGAAVVDPHTWAADVAGTVGAVVNGTIDGVADLIRGV